MKQYTNEQVDGARKWAKDSALPEEQANINGISFSYFIIPQIKNPELTHFVWNCSNPQNGVFGIADSVPAAYRPFAVYHEVIESKMQGEGACRRALEEELRVVPQEILPGYVAMRADFFKNLAQYAEAHKDRPQEDIDEFRDNASRLEKLLPKTG